jgi:hypothetical protein
MKQSHTALAFVEPLSHEVANESKSAADLTLLHVMGVRALSKNKRAPLSLSD